MAAPTTYNVKQKLVQNFIRKTGIITMSIHTDNVTYASILSALSSNASVL